MAEIALEKIDKIYPDGTQAVFSMSLGIEDAEFMVLVGPSGCGKTTALRMVAGLEDISAGTVRIGERVVNDVAPKDRDVAMVFQNYALYPHMSVYDNMAFGLKLQKKPKDEIERRVNDAAKILGLSDFLARKPRNLSGGQRQRVAMGRAIVRNPQAFLMDEPLSNLDAKLRVRHALLHHGHPVTHGHGLDLVVGDVDGGHGEVPLDGRPVPVGPAAPAGAVRGARPSFVEEDVGALRDAEIAHRQHRARRALERIRHPRSAQ